MEIVMETTIAAHRKLNNYKSFLTWYDGGLDSVGQERGSAHLLLEDHHQEAAEGGRGQDQELGQELDVFWTMLSGLEETCQLSLEEEASD